MKILFVSDSLCQPTGLTNVCVQIMTHMKKINPSLEIAHASITGEAPDMTKIYATHGIEFINTMGSSFKVYDANVTKGNPITAIDKVVSEFKPDIVFSNHDPWWCDAIHRSEYRDTFLWYYYATIETPVYPETISRVDIKTGRHFETSIKKVFEGADLVIPVTHMAHKVITEFGATVTPPVYHGVDLDEEIMLSISKHAMFNVSEDSFVFMTVGVNSQRKMICSVLEAFAKFLDIASKKGLSKEKFALYIHTDVCTQQGGTDILALIKTLNIQNYVRIMEGLRVNIGEERKNLLRKYKAADAFISLPGGEGFGLCFTEAMLQSTPVIYSEYGGHYEYCKKVSGYSVPIAAKTYAKNMAVPWAIADTNKAAEVMYKLITDDETRNTVIKKSREYILTQSWKSKVSEIYSIIMNHATSISSKRKTFIGSSLRRHF